MAYYREEDRPKPEGSRPDMAKLAQTLQTLTKISRLPRFFAHVSPISGTFSILLRAWAHFCALNQATWLVILVTTFPQEFSNFVVDDIKFPLFSWWPLADKTIGSHVPESLHYRILQDISDLSICKLPSPPPQKYLYEFSRVSISDLACQVSVHPGDVYHND